MYKLWTLDFAIKFAEQIKKTPGLLTLTETASVSSPVTCTLNSIFSLQLKLEFQKQYNKNLHRDSLLGKTDKSLFRLFKII